MNALFETLPVPTAPGQPGDDEYRDEATGLLYCKECRSPRETDVILFGQATRVRCLCACRKAAIEREELGRRKKEFLDTVARNRSVGLSDPCLRKHTFENDRGENPEQTAMARRFVEHWQEFRERSLGLLFWGGVGSGKTFLAGCIANALLDKGVTVLMTNFIRLLNRLMDLHAGDRNAVVDDFNRYELLILDDFGVERGSEFAQEQMFHIVDSRYRSQLPMIVTTNLTLDELKEPQDLGRARICDRLLERCVPIQVPAGSLRQQNKTENLNYARSLLQAAGPA